jgi:hypothetical protein
MALLAGSLPGYETHAQGAVMALLASRPFTGDQTSARGAGLDEPFTFNRGKTYVHCSSAAT